MVEGAGIRKEISKRIAWLSSSMFDSVKITFVGSTAILILAVLRQKATPCRLTSSKARSRPGFAVRSIRTQLTPCCLSC